MTIIVNTQQKVLDSTETQVSQVEIMCMLFMVLKLRLASS